MSLLEQEGCAEGSDLFSDKFDEFRPWFVLHTRSRQEKAVAADLLSLRAPHFLPLVTQVRHYGRRKIRVALPMFPGYLFVRASKQQVYHVDRANRLVSIIPVAAQGQLNWELKNLHLALSNKACLGPYPFLKLGMRVEVRSGPFRGIQGLIDAQGRDDLLILQVQMLGRAMSLEIEASLLDVI